MISDIDTYRAAGFIIMQYGEYAPYRIRVNAIAPSVTLSDRVKRLLEQSSEIEKIAESHLLGLGWPIHIADMAVISPPTSPKSPPDRFFRWIAVQPSFEVGRSGISRQCSLAMCGRPRIGKG